ncbi:MAG: hypothetical protein KAS62_06090 [Candidatus Delongbacteria bacterium]|nr:hypothetical protein [Candidatus Delongbacteria bacterium]
MTLIIIIGILLLIGSIIAIFATISRRKENRKPNYKAFFIIGVCWVPIGIATQNYVFMVIGLVFLVLGLLNRKSWENQPKWEDLSPAEKKIKLALIIFLSLILILGVVFYFMAGN